MFFSPTPDPPTPSAKMCFNPDPPYGVFLLNAGIDGVQKFKAKLHLGGGQVPAGQAQPGEQPPSGVSAQPCWALPVHTTELSSRPVPAWGEDSTCPTAPCPT